MKMDKAIILWLSYVDLKITDIYSNYDVIPVMPFYKFNSSLLDDDHKVFIAAIEKKILDKSENRLNGLSNKKSVRIDATSNGQHGIFFVTLYDGYFCLSLTIKSHSNYTT